MPWSGGSYTKGNNATGGWTGDASLGIGIEAGRHDTQDNDFATGINQCLNKDGSNAATGPLNAGGFKVTNAANATVATDVVTLGQAQAGISTSGTALNITNTQFSNNGGGPLFEIRKSRGATVGTNTIVQNGDAIGQIVWQGANGTGYTDAAAIGVVVSGTPGATNDMPGTMIFATTPDGSGTFTERMRIDSEGKVGIGLANPSSFFHVKNSLGSGVNAGTIVSDVSGDLPIAALVLVKKDNNSTTSQVLMQFLMNGAANGQGQINANGALQAAFGSYSDERLKENIQDLPSQLANIFALRPVEFDYKDGSGHQIGFIAQEVQDVYPDLIGVGKDGYLTLSGLGKNEARMIKAFQEFAESTQATITALETRVAALEA
jgi:hypothetical protein